jgi:hypothetical protein
MRRILDLCSKPFLQYIVEFCVQYQTVFQPNVHLSSYKFVVGSASIFTLTEGVEDTSAAFINFLTSLIPRLTLLT